MAVLSRITLYPIKSLDGVSVDSAGFLPGGALRHDRRYALLDRNGVFINAKRYAEIHRLRADFELQQNRVTLAVEGLGGDDVFAMDEQRAALGEWFSDYFGFSVRIAEHVSGGFPDDTVYPGPTLISTQTIQAAAGWFDTISEDSMRRRLRANLEISADAAFWEDRLLDQDQRPVPFRVGAVRLQGGNPCQRCPVPARDPFNGSVTEGFQARFSRRREDTLPAWANADRFDHYYRVSVNTRLADDCGGWVIRTGDPLWL